MDCSLPGSFVHGILQARIPERVATSFSRGCFWPRDQTCVSCIGCLCCVGLLQACSEQLRLGSSGSFRSLAPRTPWSGVGDSISWGWVGLEEPGLPGASLFLSVVSLAWRLLGSWSDMFTQGPRSIFPETEAGQAGLPFMFSLRSHTASLLPHCAFWDSSWGHLGSSEVRGEQPSPLREDAERSGRAQTAKVLLWQCSGKFNLDSSLKWEVRNKGTGGKMGFLKETLLHKLENETG